MNLNEIRDNYLKPPIELDLYEYGEDDDSKKWMSCECGGLIPPFSAKDPPYVSLHHLHCVLCGRRYRFKSLGPILEARNEALRKYYRLQQEETPGEDALQEEEFDLQ